MPIMLITGASRGIGKATARLAATQGFGVCINYRDSAREAQELTEELASLVPCCAVQADIRHETEVERLFYEAESQLGTIDVLVNNAAYTGPANRQLIDLEYDLLRQVIDVNIIGSILCARAAARRMIHRAGTAGGHIINISSIAAKTGSPKDWVDYAASKGAIETLTRGLARELAEHNIRVNAVAPGFTDTELHERAGAPDRAQRLASQTPMRRAATATEIAECILWLASTAPEYINGAVLPVTGGL